MGFDLSRRRSHSGGPGPVPTIPPSVPCPAPLLSRPARAPSIHRSAPAWRVALTCAGLALSACADAGPAASSGWLLLGLALPLLAWGFHALGQLRAQRRHDADLRALRQELRLRREIDTAWVWRSDAAHKLLQWQAPGQADPLPDADSTAAIDAALQPQLRAGRSFLALPLQLQGQTAAGLGRHWRVSASVCVDDAGAFNGFLGRAENVDAEQQLQATVASLDAALGASGGAVLAWDEGQGYVVRHVAPAPLAAWPGVAPGRLLADCIAPLPDAVAAAIRDIGRQPAGTRLEAGGWRLQRFDAAPDVAALWVGRAQAEGGALTGGSEAEQFSMTVSHDLRAPIRVVEGFTRIVKEDYGRLLDRVGNDHLDRVLGAATRMNLMIDALLTLARLSTQPLARQPVNLTQLAQYVVEDLRRHAPERVADVEIEPGLTAQGDPTLLRLVLENLLGNAWKYTGRCTRARIVLRAVLQGGQRTFEVEDNGAGFDMRSAERLFGLFQRLHSANDFPGHGVGLASVRRIVQRHGGSIWAEAEPGRGAVFYFTLPG